MATIRMLETLPWPKHLRLVTQYAGAHHERMDGKGYSSGLTREQMSLPARIIALADVLEALMAGDRPYKSAKTLREALVLLREMALYDHIDPDLFDLSVRQKVYLRYARGCLPPEQIDEVDEARIPSYRP